MTPPVESFHIFNEPVPSEEERRNEEEEEKEEGRTKGKERLKDVRYISAMISKSATPSLSSSMLSTWRLSSNVFT